MKPKFAGECAFCKSRKCHRRIYTNDLRYDEVACLAHGKELELNADAVLGSKNGVMRHHFSSTAKVYRGEVYR